MPTEQNIATFRRVIEEGLDKGNMDAPDDCFAPGYLEHQFDLPPMLEGFKGSINYRRNTFADFSLIIENGVAQGDEVWARMKGLGTHSQEFMGRPPTGKSFVITVVAICRFEKRKIVEHWGSPRSVSPHSPTWFLSQATSIDSISGKDSASTNRSIQTQSNNLSVPRV